MAQGLLTFSSLSEALKAGYQLFDKTPDGYLVRIKQNAGWAMALVVCKLGQESF